MTLTLQLCILYVLYMYTCHVLDSLVHAMVVFHGYHGSSTKDEAHRRRKGDDMEASMSVSADMRLSMNKKAFLATSNSYKAGIHQSTFRLPGQSRHSR